MERAHTIAELNDADPADFVRILGHVFEHSPWVAEATWSGRPFETVEDLHAALCQTVREAGDARQLALIRSHPDLVGRAALAGTLTPASKGEQAGAGLDRPQSRGDRCVSATERAVSRESSGCLVCDFARASTGRRRSLPDSSGGSRTRATRKSPRRSMRYSRLRNCGSGT